MVIKTKRERITVREAAKECGRNAETIRRWIWSGKLPAEKLGNQLYVKREDLMDRCATIAKYKTVSLDLIERAARLRQTIKNRTGIEFDAAKLITEIREERDNELKQSLH